MLEAIRGILIKCRIIAKSSKVCQTPIPALQLTSLNKGDEFESICKFFIENRFQHYASSVLKSIWKRFLDLLPKTSLESSEIHFLAIKSEICSYAVSKCHAQSSTKFIAAENVDIIEPVVQFISSKMNVLMLHLSFQHPQRRLLQHQNTHSSSGEGRFGNTCM